MLVHPPLGGEDGVSSAAMVEELRLRPWAQEKAGRGGWEIEVPESVVDRSPLWASDSASAETFALFA
jgi:hypothetical protein